MRVGPLLRRRARAIGDLFELEAQQPMVRTELEEEERLFFDPDLLRGDDVFAEVETG